MDRFGNADVGSIENTVSSKKHIPPIYVISMARYAERRRHVLAEGQRLGLNLKLFDAVTPKSIADFPDFYDRAYRKKHFGYEMTPGEVGCFLSHRALWQLCAESDDAVWCILEDDVALHSQFVEKIGLALDSLADWDILRLMSERWDRRGKLYRPLDRDARLVRYVRQPQGTAAYLIRPEAAKTLLAYTENMRDAVDKMMDQYWRHGLRLLVLEPAPVSIAEALPSIIQARGWAAEHRRPRPLWRRLQRDLRNGREAVCAYGYLWIQGLRKVFSAL